MNRLLCIASFLVIAFAAGAQEAPPVAVIDLTLVDVTDISNSHLRVPTMQQSVDVTSAFYEASAVAIQRLYGEHKVYSRLTIGLFDLITIADAPLPLGDVWVHEEFHRAVLSNRGIGSYDDVYRFDFSGNSIAVSQVRDEDLARLKREHPADQVRLQEAGIEGELMLTQRLQKNQFFRGSDGWHLPLYWIVKVGTWGYVQSGGTRDADVETDDSNASDGTDIMKRDFTGHDFNGWVYDLFRPEEPYEARGPHPSGVGINRYRKSTDMTPHEREFLQRQGRLHLINFIDPNLFGLGGVNVRGVKVNANAAHFLTSFGYTIDGNVFLRANGHSAYVTLHGYVNAERSFPGVDVELIEETVRGLKVSPRVALWLQPENQRFRDTEGAFGGMLGVRVAKPMTRGVSAYVDLNAKTAGWVAGNVNLDRATEVRFGVSARIGG